MNTGCATGTCDKKPEKGKIRAEVTKDSTWRPYNEELDAILTDENMRYIRPLQTLTDEERLSLYYWHKGIVQNR